MSKIRRIPGQGRSSVSAPGADTAPAPEPLGNTSRGRLPEGESRDAQESLVSAGFIRWRDEEMEIFLPAGVTARSIGVATINGGAR